MGNLSKFLIIFFLLGFMFVPVAAADLIIKDPVVITDKIVKDAQIITRYTPYCWDCWECEFYNNTILTKELLATDITEKLVDYNTKEILPITLDSKTAKLNEIYIEKTFTQMLGGIEICYHHKRTDFTKDLVLDIIPTVLGIEVTWRATWSPTATSFTNPLNGTYISGTGQFINASITDSNLDQVFYRMEWTNGTNVFNWIEMIGHDEISATSMRTGATTGIFSENGRNVYTPETSRIWYNYGIVSTDAQDNKWDCGGWKYDLAGAIGGVECTCYKPELENCTGAMTVQFRDSVCDLYAYAEGYGGVNGILHTNFSFDNTTWNWDNGWSSIGIWYEVLSNKAGTPAGNGWYNYTVYFKTRDVRPAIFPSWGGIKCVPQTSATSDRTSFYQKIDTTAYPEGLYRLRLNITNTTIHDNTTFFHDATIDNYPPSTCSIIYPPNFDTVCGDTGQCGYINLNPITNVTAEDTGSGIKQILVTWTGSATTLGNFTAGLQDGWYINNSAVTNDDYTVCVFCEDNAGGLNSSCTTATVKWYGITEEQNATLFAIFSNTDFTSLAAVIALCCITALFAMLSVSLDPEKHSALRLLFFIMTEGFGTILAGVISEIYDTVLTSTVVQVMVWILILTIAIISIQIMWIIINKLNELYKKNIGLVDGE